MLTLQIVPYSDLHALSSVGRIRKLLNLAKEDKLILVQGRLRKEEEAELIKATMEEICENVSSTAKEYGVAGNYVDGANIAGFKRVADAMIAEGI